MLNIPRVEGITAWGAYQRHESSDDAKVSRGVRFAGRAGVFTAPSSTPDISTTTPNSDTKSASGDSYGSPHPLQPFSL